MHTYANKRSRSKATLVTWQTKKIFRCLSVHFGRLASIIETQQGSLRRPTPVAATATAAAVAAAAKAAAVAGNGLLSRVRYVEWQP